MNGWHNLDKANKKNIINWTAPKLPYKDSSVDCIFSEHFMEHLPKETAITFLNECFRVLKPGCRMRMSMPNLKTLATKYLENDLEYWSEVGWTPSCAADLMNEGMKKWGHQYIWDADHLIGTVKDIGFKNAFETDYRKSEIEYLNNLEIRPHKCDLIIECIK